MTDPEPQLSAVEWHTEDATGDRVHDVQRDFPHYRIWWEVTGSRGPRYVARARQLGVTPHTVVTADLAELTAELRAEALSSRILVQGPRSAQPARPSGGDVMALHWVKEASPRWDLDKQRLFGPDELAAVGCEQPAPSAPIADE